MTSHVMKMMYMFRERRMVDVIAAAPQVVDFPDAQGPKQLCYDEEWLAVLRGTHHLLSLHPRPRPLPGECPNKHDIKFSKLQYRFQGDPSVSTH